MRLKKDYIKNMGKNPNDKVSCRLYFSHAFNSCILGFLDLGLKVVELFLYGLCLLSMGLMKVMPWRKQILADKISTSKLLDR